MYLINNYYTLILFLILGINILPSKLRFKYDNVFFLFTIALIITAISIRHLIFSDDENYLSMLQDFKNISTRDLGKISFLFYYLNLFILNISDDVSIALKINFILIWIFFLMTLFIENVKYKTTFLTFFFLLFQVLFFIQLRNALALVFLNWGIIRTFKNKNSLLIFFIATLFHYSVLPFILIYYFINFNIKIPLKFSKKKFITVGIISILISISFYNIYYNYISILPVFEKYFLEFINTPEVGNTSYLQLSLLFFHLILLFKLNNNYEKNSLVTKSGIIVFLGLLFGLILATLPLFQRIILPFILYAIISHIYIFYIKNIKFPKWPYYYYIMIIAYWAISINRISYFETWNIF
jgi:hypothetical protein